ncbi:MAG: single-stranded-DNA-specific exonuclease RecJ [Chloroflexi bacterium]|nr:single-stranded-DNA-specific exonuclease RecJ [Chloroflexota bacterium]
MQTQLTKRWHVPSPISSSAAAELADFSPIEQQILYNRGVFDEESARRYLQALPPDGTDPFNLLDMDKAIARMLQALQAGDPMAVYGDYDADGVTATALMVQALRAQGANVVEYIPNRFDEGYGLNNEALATLAGMGVKLVITVDCGIRSQPEALYAASSGLDLIISDHHQPLRGVPQAVAVINPKQDGDPYPEKDLAGVGLAFKMVQALYQERPVPGVYAEDWLDLVALGTVADLVPLTGENRAFVRRGIKRMREPKRQGLASLAAAAGLDLQRVNAGDIGYVLGPRLNAAGRLESALASFRLLTTLDPVEAGLLAQQLEVQNTRRKQITQEIEGQAELQILAGEPGALLIFAADKTFNSGVVGLAASHLAEAYYRPAIVGTENGEVTRCSCRSIPEFHITQALDECSTLLLHHGGHAAAAGFTVSNANLPQLLEQLQGIAERELGGRDLQPVLVADLEIALSDLHPNLLPFIDQLQPTGLGNPEPVFISRDVKVRSSRSVGKDAKHLKLTVTDGKITYDAIGFRLGHLMGNLPGHVDLMYTFERNEYAGQVNLQLKVRDIKPSN